MKSGLDKSIDSLDIAVDVTELKRKASFVNMAPSQKELDDFYDSLNKCKIKPVCLSLEEPYADAYIYETSDICSILDLFDPKHLKLDYNNATVWKLAFRLIKLS